MGPFNAQLLRQANEDRLVLGIKLTRNVTTLSAVQVRAIPPCSVHSAVAVAAAADDRQNSYVNLRLKYPLLRPALLTLLLAMPAIAQGPPTQRKPARYELIISSESFRPSSVTVLLGDSVVWRNTDIVRHTTTSRKTAWDSGILKPGARFVWVPSQIGVFEYFCSTHKGMKGTITVR